MNILQSCVPIFIVMTVSVPQKISENLCFNYCNSCQPVPGSAEELLLFDQLQKGFAGQYELFFPDNHAPKTIVVIPSLTLDQEVLSKIEGALYYEERLLCLLMLLRMPRTHVVYISSMPIDEVIIDYYLHLLPGITGLHARERLTLLSCYDPSCISLTEKILQRPRLIERIRQGIPRDHVAHIASFNTTAYERTLAVRLNIPIYGCDPALIYMGTKSGSRRAFRDARLLMPPGFEDICTFDEIVHAVAALKDMYPDLKKAVIKMNDGFSGEGNAVIEYPEGLTKKELFNWVHKNLDTKIKPVAIGMSFEAFMQKFAIMEGVVEAFIEGEEKTSPSVQCRVNPLGEVDIISTHEQDMGGESGQVFLGAHFPAKAAYSAEIASMSKSVAEILRNKGILGRFGIDFISVKENDQWKHYALEINLRKGGTTHPFLMLQFLTNGHYDAARGVFETPNQQQRFYFASDNLQKDAYKGITPYDLIEIAMFHGLHFDGANQQGVMFHMIGAVSQFGKLGVVCIGNSPEAAHNLFEKTVAVLDAETAVR